MRQFSPAWSGFCFRYDRLPSVLVLFIFYVYIFVHCWVVLLFVWLLFLSFTNLIDLMQINSISSRSLNPTSFIADISSSLLIWVLLPASRCHPCCVKRIHIWTMHLLPYLLYLLIYVNNMSIFWWMEIAKKQILACSTSRSRARPSFQICNHLR